jgi:hypothetical protein
MATSFFGDLTAIQKATFARRLRLRDTREVEKEKILAQQAPI